MLCQKGNNLTQRRVAPIETAGTTSMMATGIVPQSTRDPTRRSSSMDFLCRCAVDRFPLDEEKKKINIFLLFFLINEKVGHSIRLIDDQPKKRGPWYFNEATSRMIMMLLLSWCPFPYFSQRLFSLLWFKCVVQFYTDGIRGSRRDGETRI